MKQILVKMKSLKIFPAILFLCLTVPGGVWGQAFIDISAGITGVEGAVKWGDYDSDGDLDLAVIGRSSGDESFKFYRNDGNQTFTEVNLGIQALDNADVDWGDYDADGKLDIIVTGDYASASHSTIYRQNPSGTFTDIEAGLLGLGDGSCEWGDYDNDGDLDALICGFNIFSGTINTKIYTNNKVAGTFDLLGASLPGVQLGNVSWGDYDNDNDLDIVLTGKLSGGAGTSKIFRNDDDTLFTDISAGLTGVNHASADWGDYDGDDDLDLLITGWDGSSESTKLYRNDGSDTFTNISHSMLAIYYGSAKWGDFDSDGDVDIALAGRNSSTNYTKLYRNDSGTFNEISTEIPGYYYSSLDWGDYDANGNLDLIVSGYNGTTEYTKIFNNLKFEKDTTAALTGLNNSNGDWGDYDNDGDLDLIVIGADIGTIVTKLYRNDGSSVFTSISNTMQAVYWGAVKWGDYDNDGDLDIALVGYNSSTDYSKIYRNESGTFNDISAGLPGVQHGAIDWGDYDNDGDLDLLLTGDNSGGAGLISRIYKNDDGVFSDISAGLPGKKRGAARWGDYDSDGDLDLVLTGNDSSEAGAQWGPLSVIYRNDAGTFTDISASLIQLGNGNAEWGDYDGDGDLDLLLSGVEEDEDRLTKIYRNDAGTFSDISAGLTGVHYSNADWGDFDNDGDLDILINGSTSFGLGGKSTKIYQNFGSDTFVDVTFGIPDLSAPSAAEWADYDNDGDLDFLISGYTPHLGSNYTSIYENKYNKSNTTPNAPSNLSTSISGSSVTFSWDKATDTETAQNGLTYNLRIGTSSGGSDVFSGMVNSSTGFRRIANFGNAGHKNSHVINNITLGEDHYWSVQTVDNTYKGSAFASEGSFNYEGFLSASAGFFYTSSGYPDWGDYDNDGDLDLLLTGSGYTELYKNTSGSFATVTTNVIGVSEGQIKWGDYDNDGDLDVAIVGDSSGTKMAKIYRNDGSNTFTDISASLTGVYRASCDWGDYDNDGDLDLAISGDTGSGGSTKIYTNNSGVFTDSGVSLTGVYYSHVKWVDIDNDKDQDLMVLGYTGSAGNTTIYRNDGGFSVDSTFTHNLAAMSNCTPAFGDYDNDGDTDIAIPYSGSTGVYYNNGSGSFTTSGWTGPNLAYGFADWGDCDNDGDLDLLIGGQIGSTSERTTRIYRNDGSNTFTDLEAGLTGVQQGIANWGDYDGDDDLDLVVIGWSGSSQLTKLYKNYENTANTTPTSPANLSTSQNGTSVTFSWDKATDTETSQNALTYNVRIGTSSGASDIYSGMVNSSTGLRTIADVGNTGHLNSGILNNFDLGTYYWSVQTIDNAYKGSAFASEKILYVEGFKSLSAGFYNSNGGNYDWGDYDNDGDLDIIITGNYDTKLYKNTNGSFSFVDTDIIDLTVGQLKWGDYDNDGDLDIAIVGQRGVAKYANIYRNDGSDTFTDIATNLTGVQDASCDWGDYDNDGDLDLVVAGYSASGKDTKIYTNNGGVFTNSGISIIGAFNSQVKWVDLDNDKDMDLFVSGWFSTGDTTEVYRNDGGGAFVAITHNLPQVLNCKAAFGDYDSDGDMDIAIPHDSSGVYYNNGSGSFTKGWSGPNLSSGFADWGDFDNDGDLDLIFGGMIQSPSERISRIYRNDGGNTFTDIEAGLIGVRYGTANWGDYDGDNDLDLVISGGLASGNTTTLYKNYEGTSNTAPNAPTSLSASSNPAGTTMTFSWTAATDDFSAQASLTYNLRVGTTSGGNEVLAAMSTSSGGRLIAESGNVGHATSWAIDSLDANTTYYWSVQTVDNSYIGSTFPTQQTDTSLPVELSYFRCVQEDQAVQITWATESETENLGFIIERASTSSATGTGGWTEIAGFTTDPELEGQGSTSRKTEYAYSDKNIEVGKLYIYRLADVSYEGIKEYHNVPTVEIEIEEYLPTEFALQQNYPNPFNPATTIRYGLPEDGKVSLLIYDIRGSVVKTMDVGAKQAGWYNTTWNGIDDSGQPVSTGLYLTRLHAGSYTKTIKMLYLK